MRRIAGPGATQDNRFTEGNAASGLQPTMVTADWCNDVQEEIVSVIAGAGIALDGAKQTQLRQAITAMIAANIPAAPPVASTEAAGIAERATDAEALAGTDGLRFITPAQLLPVMRSMMAGTIVEWENETIPTLADSKPLGLELNGSVVSLDTFPNLLRKWCGSAKNATAPAWFRCTAAGVRDAAGSYIKLQDRRGEFARGWDHGRGVDAGRVLGSAQGDQNKAHNHGGGSHTHWSGNSQLAGHSRGPEQGSGRNRPDGNATVGYEGTTSQPKEGSFIASEGGSETRPRSIATMFIVLV